MRSASRCQTTQGSQTAACTHNVSPRDTGAIPAQHTPKMHEKKASRHAKTHVDGAGRKRENGKQIQRQHRLKPNRTRTRFTCLPGRAPRTSSSLSIIEFTERGKARGNNEEWGVSKADGKAARAVTTRRQRAHAQRARRWPRAALMHCRKNSVHRKVGQSAAGKRGGQAVGGNGS